MDTLILLSLTILIFIAKYVHSYYNYVNYFKSRGIPFVHPLPIMGNIWPTLLNRLQFGQCLKSLYDRFPNARYIAIFDFMTPAIMIRDPKIVKSIGITDFDHFYENYGFTSEVDPVFFHSLLQLKGQRWKEMRSLMSPSFTSGKLKKLFDFMTKSASEYVEDLLNHTEEHPESIEMKSFITRFTNDVICKFLLGINVNATKDPNNQIYSMSTSTFSFKTGVTKKMFLLKNFRSLSKTFRIKLFNESGCNFFSKLMREIIDVKSEKGIVTNDFVESLTNAMNNEESKVKLTFDDIVSQVVISFLGGLDTTAAMLSFVIYVLVTEPEVYQKLRREVDQVFEKSEGNPSYEDIQEMKYMGNVLKEVGRMYGPIPLLTKKCTKSYQLPPALPGLEPLLLEPGDVVYLPVFALHRDPELYENPDTFDPDRFSRKRITSDNGYYMPFGIGPRGCIGGRLSLLEMKVLVFHMVARCDMRISPKNSGPLKFANLSFLVLLRDDFWIDVKKRLK